MRISDEQLAEHVALVSDEEGNSDDIQYDACVHFADYVMDLHDARIEIGTLRQVIASAIGSNIDGQLRLVGDA